MCVVCTCSTLVSPVSRHVRFVRRPPEHSEHTSKPAERRLKLSVDEVAGTSQVDTRAGAGAIATTAYPNELLQNVCAGM